MARSLLVHARLPDTFWYHALVYATYIFNVLPVRGIKDEQDYPAAPHELFFREKPIVGRFHIFGCPAIVCHWVTQQSSQGKQTERGIRGIFIGFNANNEGYMIFCPGSRSIIALEDITFDEHFSSAIATTWQQHKDELEVRPVASSIPLINDTIEHTGGVDTFHASAFVEEGGADTQVDTHAETAHNSDGDNDIDTVHAVADESIDESSTFDIQPLPPPAEEPLHILDNSHNLRRSTRARKPNPKYSNAHFANVLAWVNTCSDQDLAEACAAEVHPNFMPNSQDAHSWEPAPKTIHDIIKLPEGYVKSAWLKSVKQELKTLIDSGTFVSDTMKEGKVSTPIMEIFKVKIKSDGSVDKLKTRLVVRGDLQTAALSEDKWSPPTASFCSLKMFLAHAARLKARVKQLDFVEAFLQVNTRTRIFVTIPLIFGNLFPEFKIYCGTPVRLAKSIYGMTLSGKYWWLDLLEFLLSIGFKPSKSVPCLFIFISKEGKIYV